MPKPDKLCGDNRSGISNKDDILDSIGDEKTLGRIPAGTWRRTRPRL